MEPRLRAIPKQFVTLLEHMEKHGDIGRPQPGLQGRLRADCLWQELAYALNSVAGGVQKSSDKWKKVWADWKTKTRKKSMLIRRHSTGTGGGPSRKLTLTDLEERLLTVLRRSVVPAPAEVEEQEFGHACLYLSEHSQQESPPVESSDNLDLEIREAEDSAPISPAATAPAPASSTPLVRQSPQGRHSPTACRSRRSVRSMSVRRRLLPTTFDRVMSKFVAIEQRRLELEEMRLSERRERETERLRVATQRLEVDRELVRHLGTLATVAQTWLDQTIITRIRD